MISSLKGRGVVVTGAGGFIGPHVVQALRDSGASVRAIVAAPGQTANNLPEDVEALFVDVTDVNAMRDAVRDASAVVHLAGPASVAESFANPTQCVRVHVGGTVSALDACRLGGVVRFVYLSSAEVYGRPRTLPVSEDHPVEPRSPYGASKAAAECAVRAYSASFGLSCAVLRPFSVYGPGVSPDSLVGTIARQVRAGGTIELADLRPIRDYCFVSDLAQAIVRACAVDLDGYAVFNTGSGKGTSVAELAALASNAAGRRQDVRERADGRRPQAAEIFNLVADVRRASEILDWSATTSLNDGLAATLGPPSRQTA